MFKRVKLFLKKVGIGVLFTIVLWFIEAFLVLFFGSIGGIIVVTLLLMFILMVPVAGFIVGASYEEEQ